jgi:Zn-dependent peptidase ImmA (M78 family)
MGILKENKIKTAPVDIEQIAEHYGLVIIRQPAEEKVSGFILRENESVIIGVNSIHHTNRQRFTIAHEIGHFLLHRGEMIHIDSDRKAFEINLRDEQASTGLSPNEKEANLFAAELLMPRSLLTQDVRKIGRIDLLYNEDIIRELAKKYKVSVAALTFRLANLNFISIV